MFENAEIIHTYTRKEAIEDGYQTKLEDENANLVKEAGYKYPVFLTSGVLGLIEKAVASEKDCNDFTGVLWDILHMSRAAGQPVNDRMTKFKVIITGTGRQKEHEMYIECGAMDFDDPAPVLTIMLPEEN